MSLIAYTHTEREREREREKARESEQVAQDVNGLDCNIFSRKRRAQ